MTKQPVLVTLRTGIKTGLRLTWEMSKVIIPTYLIVSILDSMGIITSLATLFSPVMRFIGLSGEAAIALSLGYLLNPYAAIGMMLSLSLPIREMTILAMMLCIAHSLPLELMVNRKTGIKIGAFLPMRLGLSFLSALILHLCL